MAHVEICGGGWRGGEAHLTLQLDQETIRQAKIVAAKRGTSISGLVARELELMVARSARYVEAARQAGATRVVTEDLQSGRQLGGVRAENPFA
jgi:predicted nucleic acid-binding protein